MRIDDLKIGEKHESALIIYTNDFLKGILLSLWSDDRHREEKWLDKKILVDWLQLFLKESESES